LTEPVLLIGALLVVGLVMAVTLSGRLFTMVAAKLALWTPIALEMGSVYTIVTLLLGGRLVWWRPCVSWASTARVRPNSAKCAMPRCGPKNC
jgi:hypothetical protein